MKGKLTVVIVTFSSVDQISAMEDLEEVFDQEYPTMPHDAAEL